MSDLAMTVSGAALAVAAVVIGITLRVFLFAQPASRSCWQQFFNPSRPRPCRWASAQRTDFQRFPSACLSFVSFTI